ncbi:MAG: hypothetical protein ACRYGR_00295 [Janthinobacterium lividum]
MRLIKFQKKKIDEQRLFVGQVMERVERLQAEIIQLNNTLQQEQELASHTLEGTMMFPTYAKGVNLRKSKVRRYLQEVETQLAQEQEKLRLQFAELKKFEILYDSKLEQERQEREKKMISAQDDMNMIRHYRK